jgi:hypothetical protein
MSSFSAVLFVTTTKRAVRCAQDIQRTAGLSCDRMTVEYTHDKHCDMFCDGRARTDVRDFALNSPVPGHRDVNVFRLFVQRPLQTRSADTGEDRLPTECTDSSRGRCYSGAHVVSHENWEYPSKSLQCTRWRLIGSIRLLAESTSVSRYLSHTPTLRVIRRRPWLRHLIRCAVWQWRVSRKIIVSGHMLWNILELRFNKESHYGQLVRNLSYHFYIFIMTSRRTFRSGNNRPTRLPL